MSAVVTHEINNPLTAIQNLMFLIQNSPSAPPEVKAMAEQAEEEVRRIGTIARSTLGFFRQDQEPERVDILHIGRVGAASCFSPCSRQRGIRTRD